jgi:hypothetical protein
MVSPEDLARLKRHVLLAKLASFGVLLFGLIGVVLYFKPSLAGVASTPWEITKERPPGCS